MYSTKFYSNPFIEFNNASSFNIYYTCHSIVCYTFHANYFDPNMTLRNISSVNWTGHVPVSKSNVWSEEKNV